LEKLRESVQRLPKIKNSHEKKKLKQTIISDAITFSKEITEAGELFETGEFLYSAAEIVEVLDIEQAQKLYKQNIRVWERQIDAYKIQAKIREIAEIYLKIAEIYKSKFQDYELEKQAILHSIKYLDQESKLQEEFNEVRKYTTIQQNIADLYLRIFDFKNAIEYYARAINVSKKAKYYDLLSFSYQQIAGCYEELDDFTKSKEIILDGVEYFSELFQELDDKNDNLALAQTSQILKNLHGFINDKELFVKYSKKEAGSYINLAENLEKIEINFNKISRYYRGAGLCFQEIANNLIESASCFVLAGNYAEKKGNFADAAINFIDAGDTFKELKNLEMSYKHFIKAGDNFWKVGDVNQSTECYLNAYDIALEGDLEFNRYGVFNQIVRGLNKVAKEGLKTKQFFTAATLILESVKFYEQLDSADSLLLKEMVKNVYRYYYRAANLKKVGYSHIVHSYIVASLSSILIGQIDKALEIMSEIESDGKTINDYKKMINMIIDWVSEGKDVKLDNFPYNLRRLITGFEDILYLLNLFQKMKA